MGDFANEPTGYEALHHWLSHACEEQGMMQIHLILEATGGYEAALLAYAYGQGWIISMPNPMRVRQWAHPHGILCQDRPRRCTNPGSLWG